MTKISSEVEKRKLKILVGRRIASCKEPRKEKTSKKNILPFCLINLTISTFSL